MQGRGQVVLGQTGDPERMIGTGQDVTDRMRAQLETERLEARVHQSERLESVGQLAGGIAHDFNNLLAVILNYSAFVTDELGEDHPARADVDEIRRAADRAAALTQQLLIFSRRERVKPEVFDINDVVSDTEKLLRRTLGEHVELVTTLASDLWPVEADRGQLEQVLVNLAVNARDAMPEGGRLTVETSNLEFADDLVTAHAALPPGRYSRITTTDTGTGMSREVADRVFEPFYTTKPKGSGTGLGLATVFGIVAQAGGHIDLYSEPGLGSVFKIYLPAAEGAVPSPVEKGASELHVTRGETVLLVEDEPAVRELTRRILSRHGYVVLNAGGGQEGLESLERHNDEVDLLLTDAVMPKMSGRELAEQVSALQPGVGVLYMSGYTGDVVARQGGVRLLEKPFTAEQLLAAVRAALESRILQASPS
jgi:signal transduction histidine kinase/ActR/RegA family two-component response regulator